MSSKCPFHHHHHHHHQVGTTSPPRDPEGSRALQKCPMGFGDEEATRIDDAVSRFTCPLCRCFLFDAVTFHPCGHSVCHGCLQTLTMMRTTTKRIKESNDDDDDDHNSGVARCPVVGHMKKSKAQNSGGAGIVCVQCGREAEGGARKDAFKQHMTDSYMDTEWAHLYRESQQGGDGVDLAALEVDLIGYLADMDRRVASAVAALQGHSSSSSSTTTTTTTTTSTNTAGGEEAEDGVVATVIDRQMSRATYFFRECLQCTAPDNRFPNHRAAIARAEKARAQIDPLWQEIAPLLRDGTSHMMRRPKEEEELCNLIGVISGKIAELRQSVGDMDGARQEYRRSCSDLRTALRSRSGGQVVILNLSIAQSLSTSLIKYGEFALHVDQDVDTAIQCFDENLRIKLDSMRQRIEEQERSDQPVLDGVLDLQESIGVIGSFCKLIDVMQRAGEMRKIGELVKQAREQLSLLDQRHGPHLASPQCHPVFKQLITQYRALVDSFNYV